MYEVSLYPTREETRQYRAMERAEFENCQAARVRQDEVEVRREDEERRERAAREERLQALIESLPPFEPDSMTEFEEHLIRVVRGLDERDQLLACRYAEHLLSYVEDDATSPDDSTPRPRLTLVVNNDPDFQRFIAKATGGAARPKA